MPLTYARPLRIPDLFAPATLAHLSDDGRAALTPPWPAVAIGCGRRTAAVLRWLKARAGGRLQAVYLMRPACLRGLDLAAVPEHDGAGDHPRIVRTVGALHPFDRARLDAAAHDLPVVARALPRPYTTVLVGGPAHRIRFGLAEIAALAARVSALIGATGGSALVTTSRRTPEGGAEALRQGLAVPHIVHDANAAADNPLPAFLGVADRVVVTADSLSMLSEAAATGRPVHIFPLDGTPAKMRRLRDRLAERGYIQPWGATSLPPAAPLNEARRLADLVRARAAL